MADPADILTDRLRAGLRKAFGDDASEADPVVRPSTRPEADYQANGAMGLAKRLGRNPREVAAAMVESSDLDGVCASAEVAGPGFVNLVLDNSFLAGEIATVAAAPGDERLGVPQAEHPQTIVIDYSHPNVAKEMHVGHLRSTIIGDALVRMLTFIGHRVVRHNHIGDWGTPFGMLIEHLLDIGEDEAAHELSVGDLTAFYQAARVKFDGDDAFADRARQRVVLLQRGDEQTLRFWHVLVKESYRYFKTVYDRLGVTLTDDDLKGESFYNPWLDEVAAELEGSGLAHVDDGALCVFPPGFTGREGEPLPLIIRKSDEGYGYQATDLASIRYRVTEVGADRLLYVVDAGQQLHLLMAFAVAEQAGWLRPGAAEHVAFGLVLGADGKRFKTRSGDSVKLIDLLDEAVDRAAAVIDEKNPSLDAATRAEVARRVGIGAVKYADLSTDRVKDYVFDFDRMLTFEGNTGPYLQYAYVRIQSIFRRAEVDPSTLVGAPVVLGRAEEKTLALALLSFPTAIAGAADTLQPHRLSTYLFDLASAFTSFFEACPVLKAESAELRQSRLLLCHVTGRVLERGLGLLGIDTPDRM